MVRRLEDEMKPTLCQQCKKTNAEFITKGNGHTTWKLTCLKCDEDHYWIRLEELKTENFQKYWIHHLREKRWFDESDFIRTCKGAGIDIHNPEPRY